MTMDTGIRQYRVGVGVKILRPVDVDAEGVKTVRVFEASPITDRGTYMMRASHAVNTVDREALWAYGPEGKNQEGKPVQRVGLIVFLKEPLRTDWTWIVISGIAKSGNAVFGNPVYAPMDELLEKYELSSGPTKRV